ncbi:hypothetical protein LTR78_003041 [Recurvomyces mirabilis]|uniref:CCD97-like C-terminal domain-containing protein n=1 Tax=Recurvomyces mirabilis TaxID=574656 RepID=A0AAE0WRZ9_9PEZI|nr:hypothetical protein LTR78_003041 [Recurvomyces mirabilis]KAK5157137.1 hypothetical protein LTS14_004655 [Recurvomyces mirabilis]
MKDIEATSTSGKTNEERNAEKRIVIKNRRHRYLELHPEYFHGSNLELADPLLYERLVRRFQSSAEREKEGKQRGYTGNLEADLVRSEAKLAALRNPDTQRSVVYQRVEDGSITSTEADRDESAQSREEGRRRWEDIMGQRFLKSEDEEFEYADVDENEEYDDRGEIDRKALQRYLDTEEEAFVGEGGKPEGETGIQDF